MANRSTTDVRISITHPDVNSGTKTRIDDGGNTNIEKLEMGALEVMREIVETTGLGVDWRTRVNQGLKDLASFDISAYAAFGGAGANINVGSIFKALFDSDTAATIEWRYGTGETVEADFFCQKFTLPTPVGDLTMTTGTFEFAGGAPVFTGI